MNQAIISLLITHGWNLKRASDQTAKRFRQVETADQMVRTCERHGLNVPQGKSVAGQLARCRDRTFWSRQFQPIWLRWREQQNRRKGYVRSTGDLYISEPIYRIKLERNQANKVRLEEDMFAASDHGDVVSVAKLAERTIANPANRRAELMTRMSGFEEYADESGHESCFITITAPGEFHIAYKDTGRLVRSYNGSDPLEVQKWILERWVRCRTALQDAGLFYYGLRVVEPHHDGTPHWHLLIFCEPADLDPIKRIIRQYMSEGNPRPQKGVKFKTMDPSEGSATAYIAKYISKNIDGEGLDPQERPLVARVVIWKEVWGFDQFEQLGGPPVGIWRDLRKLPNAELAPRSMRLAAIAANSGDWCAYIKAMGGPFKGRNYPIQHVRGIKEGVNGERSPVENRYGEPLKTDRYDLRPIIGLRCSDDFIQTYAKFWLIIEAFEAAQLMEQADASAGGNGAWTCDNNCRSEKGGIGLGQGPPS